MAPRSRASSSATGRTSAPRRSSASLPPRAASPSPRPPRDVLREIVDPVVRGAGFDLEQLTVARTGRRYLLRVIVDGDEGVSLDAVADLSRVISAALDEAEAASGGLMAGEYQLEVSSPGVDRPLTRPRHWRRNRGRLVKMAVAGQQRTARVLDADETGVLFDMETVQRVPYAELGPGRVQVEFNRPGEGDTASDTASDTGSDAGSDAGSDTGSDTASDAGGTDAAGMANGDHIGEDQEREDRQR